MLKTLLATAILVLASSCPAQNAQVVKLNDADALKAKQLWDEQQALTKRTADFRKHIEDAYLSEEKPGPLLLINNSTNVACTLQTEEGFVQVVPCQKDSEKKQPSQTHLELKQDWIYGFEYSKDFKYVVPAKPVQYVPKQFCADWFCAEPKPL